MNQRCTQLKKRKNKKILGSIFSNEDKEISLIGEGFSVEGAVKFGDGVVRLDGRLNGEINGQGTLIIGREGVFQGEMKVGTLILGGRTEGTVIASECARITSTGKLLGRVQAAQLVIEAGGILEGKSLKWVALTNEVMRKGISDIVTL